MKIAIGADHAGYRLKDELSAFIESLGHEVDDVGCIAQIPLIIRIMRFRFARKWFREKRTAEFLFAEQALGCRLRRTKFRASAVRLCMICSRPKRHASIMIPMYWPWVSV